MQLRRIRRRYLVLPVMLVAAGLALALSTSIGRSSGPNPSVTFSTVPAAKMAVAGIILSAPQGATPSAAAGDAAAAAASGDFGGRSVLEYHFAHCVDDQSVPGLSEDCWAVSLDPTGISSNGPPSATPQQQATYLLVLIDPTNDKFIESASGA
jgi:hypothetical protein